MTSQFRSKTKCWTISGFHEWPLPRPEYRWWAHKLHMNRHDVSLQRPSVSIWTFSDIGSGQGHPRSESQFWDLGHLNSWSMFLGCFIILTRKMTLGPRWGHRTTYINENPKQKKKTNPWLIVHRNIVKSSHFGSFKRYKNVIFKDINLKFCTHRYLSIFPQKHMLRFLIS